MDCDVTVYRDFENEREIAVHGVRAEAPLPTLQLATMQE